MKMTLFHKPMMRAAVLALCTATLSAAPMLMAQDNTAPAPQQQDNMGPPPGGHGRGMRGGRQLEMLTKRLNLTPDQVTQVKAIDDDQMSQMRALRDDTTTSGEDKRSKMMTIHQASQDKIRNVLTDEQKTKYDAMLAKMQQRRENRQGGDEGGAPPPPPPPQ
jgi:Spy/CpxP family protein refolding chaperone